MLWVVVVENKRQMTGKLAQSMLDSSALCLFAIMTESLHLKVFPHPLLPRPFPPFLSGGSGLKGNGRTLIWSDRKEITEEAEAREAACCRSCSSLNVHIMALGLESRCV